MYLELLDFDNKKQFLSFSGHFKDIELPGAYALAGLSDQKKFAAIKFVELVKNSSKQEEIDKSYKESNKSILFRRKKACVIHMSFFNALFPFNCCRWFRSNIINNSIYMINFIDNSA